MSVEQRRGLIEPELGRLSISRSSFYHRPVAEPAEPLALMRLLDALVLEIPWRGSRQIMRHLRQGGYAVSRKQVRRLMARTGPAPIYQRPRVTVPQPEHRIYRYLLRI